MLLLTVAQPRKVHPDGIHFQSLRYLDLVLSAYVGESVVIRYDPRDLAEIRVFHDGKFLCRAICPELAGRSVDIKDIAAGRNARRRDLNKALGQRASVVDRLLHVHREPQPTAPDAVPATRPPAGAASGARLKRYREE